MVVLGAGGAARGIVFGAASRGAAKVIVVNRTRERAEALAAEVEPAGVCTAASPEDLDSGGVTGDVLANTTSVGMTPKVDDSPVPAGVAARFGVVFDAVYNPRFTRLLREAKEGGAEVADGVEMFVGQVRGGGEGRGCDGNDKCEGGDVCGAGEGGRGWGMMYEKVEMHW